MTLTALRRLAAATVAAAGLLASTCLTTLAVPASAAPDPRLTGLSETATDTVSAPPPSRKDGVLLFDCGAVGPGGRCGTLQVPLDRTHPKRASVTLFFLYYPTRSATPAREGVMMSVGGPGASITTDQYARGAYKDAFDPLLATRDLVMLDQRGVGRSQAINCHALQDDPDFTVVGIIERTAKCATWLGDRATMYGSGDVAMDMEAVRRALGLKKLALYGASYSTQDVQTYASRYPSHVSVAVLDSPVSAELFGAPGQIFDDYYTDTALMLPNVADRLCARSGSCSAVRSDARDDLAWLAQRLRTAPVSGTAPGYDGTSRSVTVTETSLAWGILQSGDNNLVALSEVAAAAQSLRAGDPAPLLRLGAEADELGELFGGFTDAPTSFSWGENAARFCTDVADRLPWDPEAALADRQSQWEQHVAALPADRFGVFSKAGWLTRPGSAVAPDPCIAWPGAKDTTPSAVPGPLPASVPALVIGAELDRSIPVEDARAMQQTWPGSDYVEVKGSQHGTFFWAPDCVVPIMVRYLDTHTTGDTSCAETNPDRYSYPGVGTFARTAAATAAPTPAAGDASTATDRQVAAAATSAVIDAARRGLSYGPSTGVGLRGGTFTLAFGPDNSTQRLSGVRFTDDVAVSGGSFYTYATQKLFANVTVDGPGAEDGTLKITGVYFGFRVPTTVLQVTGTIGGRAVAVTMPAS